jgi:hypothetical protein
MPSALAVHLNKLPLTLEMAGNGIYTARAFDANTGDLQVVSGGATANIQNLTYAMYGRRPRCKRNLTFPRMVGCGHVFGLLLQPLWPLAMM